MDCGGDTRPDFYCYNIWIVGDTRPDFYHYNIWIVGDTHPDFYHYNIGIYRYMHEARHIRIKEEKSVASNKAKNYSKDIDQN